MIAASRVTPKMGDSLIRSEHGAVAIEPWSSHGDIFAGNAEHLRSKRNAIPVTSEWISAPIKIFTVIAHDVGGRPQGRHCIRDRRADAHIVAQDEPIGGSDR